MLHVACSCPEWPGPQESCYSSSRQAATVIACLCQAARTRQCCNNCNSHFLCAVLTQLLLLLQLLLHMHATPVPACRLCDSGTHAASRYATCCVHAVHNILCIVPDVVKLACLPARCIAACTHARSMSVCAAELVHRFIPSLFKASQTRIEQCPLECSEVGIDAITTSACGAVASMHSKQTSRTHRTGPDITSSTSGNTGKSRHAW